MLEWLVVPASGQARVEEAGKHAVMARTGLPARNLRVLDLLLSYPSTILDRERAIVVNLERVKAMITAAEVLLPNSKEPRLRELCMRPAGPRPRHVLRPVQGESDCAQDKQVTIPVMVSLDYSLQSYLEVMFLNPQMKVKTRPLTKTLNKIAVISGEIMSRTIQLTLGRSNVEWDRTNYGIILYWHGRLVESYKRVGGQKHNADMGRGVIGVAYITDLIDDEDGNSWVLNSKQGFQDCEMYTKLEERLGRKADEYWDKNFDTLELTGCVRSCMVAD